MKIHKRNIWKVAFYYVSARSFFIIIDKHIVEINRLINNDIARKRLLVSKIIFRMFFLVLLDADCSGRTLATLLVAWVTTAMVASILLQWEYMWIVLAILTLLFLLVCGYTAYSVKRTHARILIEQQRRAAIRTVSGITAANRREIESSTYSTHLPADLPPSYASVVTTQTSSSRASSTEDKYEDPPSYSIVIASLVNTQDRNAGISSESNVSPPKFTRNNAAAAASSASTSIACSHER